MFCRWCGAQLAAAAAAASVLTASDPTLLHFLAVMGCPVCVAMIMGTRGEEKNKTQQINANTRLLLGELISNGLTLT